LQPAAQKDRPVVTVVQKFLVAAAVAIIFFMMILLVFGENGLIDFHRLKTGQQRLEAENQALAEGNARLHERIERLKHDPAAVETVARRDLGMIGTHEIIVKFAKPLGGAAPVDLPAAPSPSPPGGGVGTGAEKP
jgi:cell division protein FtsB